MAISIGQRILGQNSQTFTPPYEWAIMEGDIHITQTSSKQIVCISNYQLFIYLLSYIYCSSLGRPQSPS